MIILIDLLTWSAADNARELFTGAPYSFVIHHYVLAETSLARAFDYVWSRTSPAVASFRLIVHTGNALASSCSVEGVFDCSTANIFITRTMFDLSSWTLDSD